MALAEIALNTACFAAALVGMEGVAWAVHRHVMHGWLWRLHKSHHQARRGPLEANDLFGVVFALIAIGLFMLGSQPGWSPLWWAAAGMTGYGVLYGIVHDGLVHRRWPTPSFGDGGFIGRLAQAHRLHHLTRDKDGAVSFGFLLPPNLPRLTEQLQQRRNAVR